MSADKQQAGARVALVTGAGGGIGAAVARTLAAQGWRLVLSDREGPALDALRQLAAALPLGGEVVAADVTCEPQVQALVRAAISRFGRLDGFVCNAGISGPLHAVQDYPTTDFEQVLAVNVLGTFLCMKHGLAAMRAGQGGCFVAMGSTSSLRGRPGLAAYVASKHAVLGLVRSAALEQVGTTVRVNAVLPGPTRTAMIAAINDMAGGLPPALRLKRAVDAPYGEPEDVAQAVAFLLSPAARHMNGTELVVDGGSILA